MTPVPWQSLLIITTPPGQRLSSLTRKTTHNWPKFCFWIPWRGISAKRKEERPSVEGRRAGEKSHRTSTATNARVLAGRKCEETPRMREGETEHCKFVCAIQVCLLFTRTAIVVFFPSLVLQMNFCTTRKSPWNPE